MLVAPKPQTPTLEEENALVADVARFFADAITDAQTAATRAEVALDITAERIALLDAALAILRARARAAGIPVKDAAVTRVEPARVIHETPAYYSDEFLPPNTSMREWKRAFKSGLPTAKLSNRKVVMIDDWNKYVASLVRRPRSRSSSDEDLLAAVGAKPRGK